MIILDWEFLKPCSEQLESFESCAKKRGTLSILIVDFDLKYLNFSAKTKHTVKMAVNVDNVPRFFLFQSFQNIRAAQNYHEYSGQSKQLLFVCLLVFVYL